MREPEFKAKEKKVQKMTRDGLAEKNLAQGTQENISSRIADVSFAKEKTDDKAAGHRAAARQQVSEAKSGKQAKPNDFQPTAPLEETDRFANATAPQIWGPNNAPASMRDAGDKPMEAISQPPASDNTADRKTVQDGAFTDKDNVEKTNGLPTHDSSYGQSEKSGLSFGKHKTRNATQRTAKISTQKQANPHAQGRLQFYPEDNKKEKPSDPGQKKGRRLKFDQEKETFLEPAQGKEIAWESAQREEIALKSVQREEMPTDSDREKSARNQQAIRQKRHRRLQFNREESDKKSKNLQQPKQGDRSFHFHSQTDMEGYAQKEKELNAANEIGDDTVSDSPAKSGRLNFKHQSGLIHTTQSDAEGKGETEKERRKASVKAKKQRKKSRLYYSKQKFPSYSEDSSNHMLSSGNVSSGSASSPNDELLLTRKECSKDRASNHLLEDPKHDILLQDSNAGRKQGKQQHLSQLSQKRLEKAQEQAEKNLHNENRHLEKAQEKLSSQRRIWLEKRYDSDSGRIKHRLQFTREAIQEGKFSSIPRRTGRVFIRAGRTAAITSFRRNIQESEQDNVGVEASYKAELAAEGLANHYHRLAKRRRQEKSVCSMQLARKRAFQAEGNYAFQQFLAHNPEMKKIRFARWVQKQKIKRQYAAAAREAKKTARHTRQAVNTTGQLIRAAYQTISAHRTVLGLVAIAALVIVLCGSLFTSCTAMLTGVQSAVLSTCYVADDAAINNTELSYTRREADLQQNIRNTKSLFPGYDEYRYNIGEIGHSPYELMGYLSAVYGDFTNAQAEAELARLFGQQYHLTRQVIVEQRTYRDRDGDEHTYDWYVLKTTLSVRPLSEIIAVSLAPGEQTERYQIYLQNGGNRQCFQSPVDFAWENFVTSPYGYRINPSTGTKELHQGVDIQLPPNTEIKAVLDGRVIFAGNDGEDGRCVVIEGKDGYQSRYAHCQSLLVHTGQEVVSGEAIATAGNSGNTTESYLHLEISHHGEYLNPCYFMDKGGQDTSPSLPGNPGETMGDGTFAAMLAEAERYLGFPYVWGGSSPSTSFDCSGYVSWVINHSGAGNVGRQTAQGLYNLCTPVSRAEMRPGDLIFFTGTYSTANPVTHVGIYVGNERMIHCGDPISYARIDSQYWLSHYYSGGRLP